jgi:hypothetical protein
MHFDRNTAAARFAQHRRGRDGNPEISKHTYSTLISTQRDPNGTFEFAAGMGMDGNHVTAHGTYHQRLKKT